MTTTETLRVGGINVEVRVPWGHDLPKDERKLLQEALREDIIVGVLAKQMQDRVANICGRILPNEIDHVVIVTPKISLDE